MRHFLVQACSTLTNLHYHMVLTMPTYYRSSMLHTLHTNVTFLTSNFSLVPACHRVMVIKLLILQDHGVPIQREFQCINCINVLDSGNPSNRYSQTDLPWRRLPADVGDAGAIALAPKLGKSQLRELNLERTRTLGSRVLDDLGG